MPNAYTVAFRMKNLEDSETCKGTMQEEGVFYDHRVKAASRDIRNSDNSAGVYSIQRFPLNDISQRFATDEKCFFHRTAYTIITHCK